MVNQNQSVDPNNVRSSWGIKAAVFVLLLIAIGLVVYFKSLRGSSAVTNEVEMSASQPSADTQTTSSEVSDGIPRLVDLGAGKCIPCKMMAPILEELSEEYKGRLDVDFIDVWEEPEAGDSYGIRLIPTQIFFDPSGTELFRHEGFYSKEDILAKWRELGVNLDEGESNEPTN